MQRSGRRRGGTSIPRTTSSLERAFLEVRLTGSAELEDQKRTYSRTSLFPLSVGTRQSAAHPCNSIYNVCTSCKSRISLMTRESSYYGTFFEVITQPRTYCSVRQRPSTEFSPVLQRSIMQTWTCYLESRQAAKVRKSLKQEFLSKMKTRKLDSNEICWKERDRVPGRRISRCTGTDVSFKLIAL